MMHDPSAVIAITDRDAFEFRQAPLRVICEGEEIGQTVADMQSGRRPVNVAVGVDSARVRKIFLDIGQITQIKMMQHKKGTFLN